MSLFPLDLDQFKGWAVQYLYYLLFPYIKEDFMGIDDCQAVHMAGNMTVMVAGAPTNVTHIIQGGSSIFSSIKEAEYRVLAEEGRIVLQTAQETGRFVGRAR